MMLGCRRRPRRSTPIGSLRPPGRRRLPGSRWPSGHRHSGSASRCRLFLDPEGDGSFEQITLHPQPRILAFQLPQPHLLVARQPVLLTTVDAILTHPVAKGRVIDAQLTGDLGDRPATGAHQFHRIAFELGGELAPVPSLSVFHADILRSREMSCLRGEVQLPLVPLRRSSRQCGLPIPPTVFSLPTGSDGFKAPAISPSVTARRPARSWSAPHAASRAVTSRRRSSWGIWPSLTSVNATSSRPQPCFIGPLTC